MDFCFINRWSFSIISKTCVYALEDSLKGDCDFIYRFWSGFNRPKMRLIAINCAQMP